jgi:hypothetical protein
MRKLGYTFETVERALSVHCQSGLIRSFQSWHVCPRVGSGADRRYTVRLHNGEYLELRSLREAYVFVSGLASAAHSNQ